MAKSKDMLKNNKISSQNFCASSENAEPARKTYQGKNIFQHVPETLVLQPNEERTILVNTLKACQIMLPKEAKITFIAMIKKGWMGKRRLDFYLQGEGASVNVIIIIFGQNEDEFSFETISHHESPKTMAEYSIRNVLFDASKVDYKGNLIIRPQAQMANAYLSHHSLLLSDNAKSHSIPSLEIEADNVKAGHAATMGRVDEEMLFYLESRGIEKEAATKLLIKGFLEADLQKIADEELRISLAKEIEYILNQKNE